MLLLLFVCRWFHLRRNSLSVGPVGRGSATKIRSTQLSRIAMRRMPSVIPVATTAFAGYSIVALRRLGVVVPGNSMDVAWVCGCTPSAAAAALIEQVNVAARPRRRQGVRWVTHPERAPINRAGVPRADAGFAAGLSIVLAGIAELSGKSGRARLP
jgi:hypothetical protein